MPIFTIQHITRYEYDRAVRESANQIKIFPLEREGQQYVKKFNLKISGEPSVQQFTDYWGNEVGWFTRNESHTELTIESQTVVETHAAASFPTTFSTVEEWKILRGQIPNDLHLLDFTRLENIESKAEIAALVHDLQRADDTPAAFIQRCSAFIFDNFEYKKGITTVETTIDEILKFKSGVCQDFAHILLQMLRSVSIPARYVSGYICPNQDGARGAGATHAWVEVFLPTAGWVGIDPTNNIWITDQHVVLAVGRDFADCTPVKGTFKGPANQKLSVLVSVGYEDGSTFEDLHAVKLIAEESLVPLQDFSKAQQQ